MTQLKEHMENMSRYTSHESLVNYKKRLFNSTNGKKSVANEVRLESCVELESVLRFVRYSRAGHL